MIISINLIWQKISNSGIPILKNSFHSDKKNSKIKFPSWYCKILQSWSHHLDFYRRTRSWQIFLSPWRFLPNFRTFFSTQWTQSSFYLEAKRTQTTYSTRPLCSLSPYFPFWETQWTSPVRLSLLRQHRFSWWGLRLSIRPCRFHKLWAPWWFRVYWHLLNCRDQTT